jgi:molybdopterin synthase sulfur carrier subunit
MAITVQIPSPLQKLTNGQAVVEVSDVATIEELLDGLESSCPGIKEKLEKDGEIRGYINIFVNDDDIRFGKGKGTSVKDGDSVTIVPSIAGGT